MSKFFFLPLSALLLTNCMDADPKLTNYDLQQNIIYNNERAVEDIKKELRKPPEEHYEIALCRELERTLVIDKDDRFVYGYSKNVAHNYYWHYDRIEEYTHDDYVRNIYRSYDTLITHCMKYAGDMEWDFPTRPPQ